MTRASGDGVGSTRLHSAQPRPARHRDRTGKGHSRLKASRAAARSAFTLRETMLAIAMGSTIMFAAMSTVHHAMNWASVSQQRRHENLAYVRLSDQLRQDIHQSDTASVSDDGSVLNLESNASIRYEITGSIIKRIETNTSPNGSSETESNTRRDSFAFRQTCQPLFRKLAKTNQIGLDVHLMFDNEDTIEQLDRDPPLVYSMRASLGLRKRYEEADLE